MYKHGARIWDSVAPGGRYYMESILAGEWCGGCGDMELWGRPVGQQWERPRVNNGSYRDCAHRQQHKTKSQLNCVSRSQSISSKWDGRQRCHTWLLGCSISTSTGCAITRWIICHLVPWLPVRPVASGGTVILANPTMSAQHLPSSAKKKKKLLPWSGALSCFWPLKPSEYLHGAVDRCMGGRKS